MRCNVCYLPIHDQTTKILCPRCTNPFHYDHLAAWLLTETKCPMCREVLSEDFREDLKPKSEKERRRLEQVLYTLDGLGQVLGKYETSRRQKKRLGEMRRVERGDPSTSSLISLALPVLLGLVAIISFILIIVLVISSI